MNDMSYNTLALQSLNSTDIVFRAQEENKHIYWYLLSCEANKKMIVEVIVQEYKNLNERTNTISAIKFFNIQDALMSLKNFKNNESIKIFVNELLEKLTIENFYVSGDHTKNDKESCNLSMYF